tara:strand:- start:9171 stop:10433 length:1263 start_codon:yes stop_codon:yes gene_type:complete
MLKNINASISLVLTTIIILLYFFQINFNSKIEIAFLFFFSLNFIFTIFYITSKNKIIKIFFFNLYIIFLFLIIIELLIFLNIISNDYIKFNTNKINSEMVEKININPWYKFNKNTIITLEGFRGSDVSYSWKTDNLGFKNVELEKNYYAIALGNSFTESFGVEINNTWTSILSKNGFKTYNAGVQGYAPSQFYGAMNLLKDKIEFKNIFIGHLHNIYTREKNFYDEDNITKATGGVESIRQKDLDQKYIFIPILTKYYILEFKEFLLNEANKRDNKIDSNRFSQYNNEIDNLNKINKQMLEKSKYWQRVIKFYNLIIEFAEKNNKKVYFVFFPTRAETYFSKKELNINTYNELQYYVEMDYLKNEFKNKNVFFIDPFEEFKNSIDNDTQLPFFKNDGHMSIFGNKILANKILNVINNLDG